VLVLEKADGKSGTKVGQRFGHAIDGPCGLNRIVQTMLGQLASHNSRCTP
jgi:hypothetical protein